MSKHDLSDLSTSPVDPAPWQTLSTQTAFQNRWLKVLLDQVQLPTGQQYEYTRLAPAGVGVGVVGLNDAGQILLEREYRHGVGEVIWQVPGGLAAAGEDLQQTGLRELLEETGYAPAEVSVQTVRYLGVIWDNPGFGVAASHLFLMRGLQPTAHPRRDAEEFVALHWVEPSWLKEAVRSGEIKDRVVVAAVAYLLLNGEME
jgi:8-oxo-dGTP pyrophosphatase MutT (NUDIX family)